MNREQRRALKFSKLNQRRIRKSYKQVDTLKQVRSKQLPLTDNFYDKKHNKV